jgi:hypothetical protein
MGRLEDESHSSPVEAQVRGGIALDDREATRRYRTALKAAVAPGVEKPPDAVVWEDAGAELLLHPARARVSCDDGLVRVVIPVYTEQTDDAEILVPFAVGRPDAPAGLVMATETRPRGPDIVVDRWAEPLLAAAWEALVGVAVNAAAPALPAALSAAHGRLEIAAQAPVEAG